MRKKIVAANWKMNLTPVEARTLIFLLAACGNILFLGWAYHRISRAIEESEATRNLYGPLK